MSGMTTTTNWEHLPRVLTGRAVAQAADAADLAVEADLRYVGLLEALRARDAEGLALGIKLPEAAKLLGVSQKHLYNQTRAGLVPSFRIGSALRYSPAALREWVAKESANSVAWQPAAWACLEQPAPKTTHVRRGGEWVTAPEDVAE